MPRARVMREAGEPPSAGRAAIGLAGTPAAPSLAAGVGRWADGAPGSAARRGEAGGRGRSRRYLDAGGKQMDVLPNSAPLATKLRNTLIRYHGIGESEWRVAKRTKDATVWRKPSEEFSGYLYKAQGVVEDVTNRIVDHIRPGPYRLDWDSLMTTMDIMETFEENCCVMRYTTAGQLWNIIAPREFVDFSYTTSYEDGLLTCGISLDYGEVRPNFVRGFNHPCGWFCVPLKDYPSHSLLTGYIQTELRGMLPQSAVDTAMSSTLANFYSDLKKALKT